MISRVPEELPPLGSHNEELHVSRKYVDTTARPRRSSALLALQFTEPSPVKSWCYHISKNSGVFRQHVICSGGRRRRRRRRRETLGLQDVNRPCCYCGATWAHRYCLSRILQKWLMICWPVVPPSVTADCRARELQFVNVLLVARKYDLDWNVELTGRSWTTTDGTQGSFFFQMLQVI